MLRLPYVLVFNVAKAPPNMVFILEPFTTLAWITILVMAAFGLGFLITISFLESKDIIQGGNSFYKSI